MMSVRTFSSEINVDAYVYIPQMYVSLRQGFWSPETNDAIWES